MPPKYTKDRLAAMFTTFCVMATSMGMREFCMPKYHPVSPYSPSMAGAPHTQMWK